MGPRARRLILPAALCCGIVALALAAPVLPLANPITQDVAHRLTDPSAGHWLGQDEYGRDVLSRIVWGARTSLAVAFLSAFLAGILGTVLGLLGGYFRGLTELLTLRSAEIVLCFPPMLLALLVVTLLGPGAATLVLVLSILYAPGFARVAYAETLSARAHDYVTAQEALGARTARVLFRTLLPNIMPALLVQASLTVAAAMVLESGLTFLGLGVVPPAPSWGLMIRGARSAMEHAPLLLLWPCLALTGAVLVFNLLCDRLRDVLDPRSGAAGGGGGLLRRLLALPPLPMPAQAPSLLAVRGLTLKAGDVTLVHDVSFDVAAGETVALVGESGSGKTLTSLAVIGLLPAAVRPVAGQILFTGRDGVVRDLLRLRETELRRLRGDQIAMVFQDPASSLNPVRRIGDQVGEALRGAGRKSARVVQLLRRVHLPDPAARVRVFPHELSGGQRQRVMIAAAIANDPRLLLADEPTTALDVTVQAQIVDLLAELKADGVGGTAGMAMLFVTHNLALVAEIADRVVVMQSGQVVEQGPVGQVFANPSHPYTVALLAAVPESAPESVPEDDVPPAERQRA